MMSNCPIVVANTKKGTRDVRTKALSEVHEVCVGQMGLEQNNDVELPNCSG